MERILGQVNMYGNPNKPTALQREVEKLFQRENIPYLNTTHFSVEEISAKILVEMGVERRLK